MKKWKIIRSITGLIILLFLLLIIFLLISNYFKDVTYPYPMLGLEVFNWFDAFIVELSLYFYIFGIPLLIDIILFIVSIVKLNKNDK